MTKTLPVIFRLWKGEAIALFPTERWNMRGDITCYAHIGQHCGACPSLLQAGRPATEAEYAPLLKELRNIYETHDAEHVSLVVYKRAPGNARLAA